MLINALGKLLKFKASWLIREKGLYPSNKSHDLPKVGLILMILGYLEKGDVG